MEKIRKLQKKDIAVITKMMLDFPLSFGEVYVKSKKRGGIGWLLNYALGCKDIFEVSSFVLEKHGTIIGHIAYLKDVRCFRGGVYEMVALVINKEHQKKGYGRRLIKYTEAKLKEINSRIVWLQTGDRKHIAYYEKLGYSLVVEWKDYLGANKHRYVMRHDL